MKVLIFLMLGSFFAILACSSSYNKEQSSVVISSDLGSGDSTKIKKTNEEWKKILDPMVFYVTREAGTERAFSGKYWDHHAKGTYTCACCEQELFESKTKFESGTGWPSFYAPSDSTAVDIHLDESYGMVRKEVVCSRCDAHLGHVFDDGPEITGLRYCINSASLNFKKK